LAVAADRLRETVPHPLAFFLAFFFAFFLARRRH